MKKRLLFAVLLSAAAGGMLYQVSWSQVNPDPPAGVDPELGPQLGFCFHFPFDPRCAIGVPPAKIPPAESPVEAPGVGVDILP